jgi:hypothetical protein
LDQILQRYQENRKTAGEKQKGNSCGKTEEIPLFIHQPKSNGNDTRRWRQGRGEGRQIPMTVTKQLLLF